MRRINHAIFRCAIARLRDACPRPGTNAMLKRRRQNGAAGKPALAACPADVTRRTRYKGQSWRTGTEGGDCLQSGEEPRSSSRLRWAFFIFKYSVLREMPRRIAACRRFPFEFLPELKQIGDYFTATNQRTILMPQCETAGALEHIEEIAALDGIDGIFVGPYDLSVALGAPARFATPRLTEAFSRVIAACRASGKLAFIYANTMPEARAYFAQGYQGATIGTDTAFLVKAIQGMLQA